MEYPINQVHFNVFVTRRFNTWYTLNDGNWSDPNIWISPGLDKHIHTSPQPGDNVYINHVVTLDTSVALNQLIVGGTLKVDGMTTRTLTINGTLQATGTLDFSGSDVSLLLNSYYNVFPNFIAGVSRVTYAWNGDQLLAPVNYYNLTISGSGLRFLAANTTIGNAFNSSNGTLDLSTFDFTVNGNAIVSNNGVSASTIRRLGSTGYTLFKGPQTTNNGATFNFSGNGDIEFQNGWATDNSTSIVMGTGNIKFTTNNQAFSSNSYISFTGTTTIAAGITLTNNGRMNFTTTITGLSSLSTLNNDGIIRYNSTTVMGNIMSTGIYNYMHGASSTLEFLITGSYTLPYTSFQSITLFGVGTKTLAGNTTIAGTLNNNSGGTGCILECSTFNLTVTGTTLSGNNGKISKTGAGALIFVGLVNFDNGGISDFSGGNPTIEFRGGLTANAINATLLNFGTGNITFSTNNQNVIWTGFTIVNNIIISGAITVTFAGLLTNVLTLTGTIDGNNANSILDHRGLLNYQNATAPMATLGKLYCNQATNTWIYGLAGNQDIKVPGDPTPGYKNLTLQGSGAKKLLGNVSVKGTYTLTGPATLNSNGFALTNP